MFKVQTPEDKLSQTLYQNTISTKESYPYLTISKFTPNTTMNNFSHTRYFETTENRLKSNPPIYYIRKVQKPYKYNITSVPQGYSNKTTTEEMFTSRLKTEIDTHFKNKITVNDVINSSSKDKFKPNGYVFRDFLIKNPKFMKPNILSSNHEKKLKKMLNYDEIRKNANSTQIQFDTEENIKGNSKELEFYKTDYPKSNKRQEQLYKHKGSDIFNLRQDDFFKSKSGEKNLYKFKLDEKNKEKVYMTNGSNSNWAPKIPKKINHIGYSSVNFNIIVPNIKSISKTKDQIETNDKCNNKVKSMSEFIDLCRVSAPNKSENFDILMNQSQSCFRKRNNICSDFLDMHRTYRETIPHPFS